MAAKKEGAAESTKKTAAKRGAKKTAVSAAKAADGVQIEDGAVYVLQPGTKIYVKTADLCAMTGKTNQWIGQLVSQGVLFKRRTAHGVLFELHEAVRGYVDKLAERKREKNAAGADLEQQKLAAEVRFKQAKAQISEYDAEERRGTMHRSEDVAAMTEDLIFAIRGALTALPGRLAVDVAGVQTASEAAEIIRREVALVMEELAGYRYDPERYLERVRQRMKLEAADAGDGEDA